MTTDSELHQRAPEEKLSGIQFVESVRRALRILQCFDGDRTELGVTEVAQTLGLHKATTHRLLATLEVEGFVKRNGNKRYELGLNSYRVGLLAMPGPAQRESVESELRSLVAKTGETAHLAVLDRNEVLYVEKVEGSHRLRLPSALGGRAPAYCTALGKVLLAAMPENECFKIVANLEWHRFTPQTIVDATRLLAELDSVRQDGLAFDNQEFEEGLTCLAAPVTGPSGSTVAAVSISGPAPRFDSYRDKYVADIRNAAASISTNATAYLRSLER